MGMYRPEEMMASRYQELQAQAEQCCYSDAVARLRDPGMGRRAIAGVGRRLAVLGRKMEAMGTVRSYELFLR